MATPYENLFKDPYPPDSYSISFVGGQPIDASKVITKIDWAKQEGDILGYVSGSTSPDTPSDEDLAAAFGSAAARTAKLCETIMQNLGGSWNIIAGFYATITYVLPVHISPGQEEVVWGCRVSIGLNKKTLLWVVQPPVVSWWWAATPIHHGGALTPLNAETIKPAMAVKLAEFYVRLRQAMPELEASLA